MLPMQASVPGSNLHVKFCDGQGVTPFASYHHHATSGPPGKASGLFRTFTGESLCPWNEVTHWLEATGAYLEELRQKGKLVCNSDGISKVANLYFVCLFEARSTSPRRVTAPKGKDS